MDLPNAVVKNNPTSKHSDNVQEWFYDAALEGLPEIDGDSSYGLVTISDPEECAAMDRLEGYEGVRGAIVLERGDGMVFIETYQSAIEAASAFDKIASEIAAECPDEA